MNELIYLEPDEEITSVIDRLRNTAASSIALVIPRGGNLAQSIVNLKLLKKSAEGLNKDISLVSTDRISRNLASQIGLTVFSKVSEAQRAKPSIPAVAAASASLAEENDMGFRVNHYYRKNDEVDPEIAAELEKKKEEDIAEKEAKEPVHYDEPAREAKSHTVEERHTDHEKNDIKREHIDHPSMHDGRRDKPVNLRGSRKPLFIILGITLALLLIVSFVFVPYATATVTLKAEDYKSDQEVTVDKNATAIDQNKMIVPGMIVSLEKDSSKDFDATGKKDNGTKASGTLSFGNSSGVSTVVAAGTTIKSSGDIEYTLDQDITVPIATVDAGGKLVPGKISGKVTAKANGDSGNLAASTTYSVTGKPLISASGSTAGGVTKTIKIVSDTDLANAEKTLKDEITAAATAELTDQAKADKQEILATQIKSEVITAESNKKTNDEADHFSYSIKLKVYTLGYSTGDLTSVVLSAINGEIDSNQMLVNPGNAEYSNTISEGNVESGTMKIAVVFSGKIGQKLSESEIIAKIRNKNDADAVRLLKALSGVDNAKVKAWPSFTNRTPVLKNRIKVKFDYSE